MYVNESLRPVEFHTKSNYAEHVWYRINKLLIGVCYRSTNKDVVGQNNYIELNNSQTLIMGDFSYPDIDWDTCTSNSADLETEEFINTIEDCFYTQHVLHPTRGDAVLDLVLSSDPDLVNDVEVINKLENSDHNMVCFNIRFGGMAYHKKRLIRNYKSGDYSSIKDLSLIHISEPTRPY